MSRGETLAHSAGAQKKPKVLRTNEARGEFAPTRTTQAKARGRVGTRTTPETSNTPPGKLTQPARKRKRRRN
jgi:hypothetical protein